ARDDRRRVGEVAGHQLVDGRERGLDRLALDDVMRAELGQRVLELVLAREHPHRERLATRRVDGVLELVAHDTAHGTSYDWGGSVVHSRIASSRLRSTWT